MKRIILPIVALLISHFSNAQVCTKAQLPTSLQNGLVAFYPFCGNANDGSGNGNNGTVNGATLTTDRFGNANSAYYFSGASCNTYIQATVNTSSIQTGVTISVWVNRSGDGCSNPRLFEFWPGSDGPRQAQWQWSNPNAIAMGHRTSTGVYVTTEVPAPSVNVWTHLVYTNDGSSAKFYRDGQLIATLASSGNPTLASNLAIGRMNHSSWDAFDGKIDDFIVYNKALSSNEVSQLFSITSDPCSISSNVPSAPALNYLPYGTTVAGGNGSGSAANQFHVVDVALDAAGNIYLADFDNYRVQKWVQGATNGVTVAGGNGMGSAATQLNSANGIALDLTGNIYVGDFYNNRVQKWIPGATSGTTVAGGNGSGSAANQLNGSSGVAIDAAGNLYVTDTYNNRIQKWAPGASSGITVAGGNGAGSASNQLNGPYAVAIDVFGNLYVADTYNHRIQKWAPGATSGITVAGGNGAGSAANQLDDPLSVTIDAALNIYVSDANNHRIQKWASGATFGITVAGGNGLGSLANQLNNPLSVAIDAARSIYVADESNNRIQKWSQQDTITLCVGSAASALVANADAGNTLRWYGTNATGGTASSNATIPSTTTAGIFNYYVSQVSTATGCESPRTRITVVVEGGSYNPLSAQSTICGPSTTLDAGSGYTSYLWSTGATSQTITATSSGEYRVTVTNATGCVASDTTSVNIIKSDILQNNSTICKGASITLSVDSSFAAQNFNSINLLPSNLKAGLKAYYPFSGNANDASGNNNNGTVTGATLTTDRFGNANSAYSFNGSSFIDLGNIAGVGYSTTQDITTSFWINEGASGTVISKYTNLDAGNSNFFISKATTTAQLAGNGTNSFTANNITDYRWANYVFIAASGTNKSFLYRNGILIATGTLNANGALSATKIMLGKLMGSPSNFFTGKIDDVFIYNRALTVAEIAQLSNFQPKVTWSNGATTNTISVTPTATTKYYATVSDGITSCIDSVTVTVDDIGSFNPFPAQSSTCGITKVLDAGAGFSSYLWNTGATSQTISPTINGEYRVTVTSAAGCSASDTVSISLIKADIIQANQTICANTTLNLFIDSTFSGSVINAKSQMSANLQTGLVAYYPFNGNAADISGNNNVLTANGVTLTTDRFGRSNSAYSFTNTQTSVTNYLKAVNPAPFAKNTYTISAWFNSRQFYPNIGGVTYNYQSIVFYSPQWYTYGPAYHLALQHANNSILEGGNWTTTNTNQAVTSANGSIVVNQWYHVVLSYDGTNIKMYKDGQLVGSRAATISYANQIQFLIGGAGDGPNPGGIYGGFNGKIDDVGFWDRALTTNEIQELYNGRPSVLWSTSETTNKISVTPAVTTKYYVTLTDGIATCTDSVTITVDNLSAFNPLQDTVKVCGDSIILDAGADYATYNWSNGATTRTITAKISGKYFVNVATAAGCSASDTSIISIVKAKILQRDTTICKGSSLTLAIDSSFPGQPVCNKNDLPISLQNGLVAYFPFCGNANDASGNGNNGTVNGAILVKDRFNNDLSAYSFSNASDNSITGTLRSPLGQIFSISFWVKRNTSQVTGSSGSDKEWMFSAGNTMVGGSTNIGISNNSKNLRYGPWGADGKDANYIVDNTWQHIVQTYSNGQFKIYINGKLYNTSTETIDLQNGAFSIGCQLGFLQEGFDGLIDDLFIYNRDLSVGDISKLYNTDSQPLVNWSTGATTNTISVTPTSTTKYFVTVSDGITTCKDSITVTVSDIGNFNPLQDTVKVCGDSLVLDAGAGYTTYRWSNGGTTRTITAKASGKYFLTVASAAGCSASDTSFVSIVNANIIQSDTTVCKGSNLLLNIGNPQLSKLKYLGSIDGKDYYLRDSVMKWVDANKFSKDLGGQLYVIKNQRQEDSVYSWLPYKGYDQKHYWLGLYQDRNSSAFSEPLGGWKWVDGSALTYSNWLAGEPNNISCEGLPEDYAQLEWTDFGKKWNDADASTSFCNGSILGLAYPIIEFPSKKIKWSTGDTTANIFVTPTTTTKYFVTVTDGITTCTDSVVVNVSSSELKLTNPAAVCSPSVVNLRDAAVTAGSAAGLTFTYWKDTNATQVLANPDRVSVSGTYYIVGTSATGCTSAPTAVKVTVNPLPVAAIVTPTQTTICDKNTLILTATGGTNYQWLYNGAAIAGATDSTYAATLGGSYEVNVIALGCTTKVAAPVNLSLIKAAIPKFSNSSTCMDVPVSFFNETDTASSGSVNYIWDFGDGQTSTMFNPVYTYKKTGAFIVKLTVTPKQCSSLPASFTKNITVDVPPVGIKYPNVLAVKNKATNLSARFIANGYTYLWMPATGLNNGAIQKPVFNSSFEQLYMLRLTSPGGCITMDTVKVSVYDSSDIFVPKAFTPNKDGKNDLLQPFLVNITTLKFFRVYNRWGQLMFQTSDSKQGWDGMYNYKPQPLETYTWIAEGIDGNGTTIFRKGQTVLIR